MPPAQFKLRPLSAADDALLREYLRLALFVPVSCPSLPHSVLDLPEIARYVVGWGRVGDLGLLAQEGRSGCDVGAAWLRLWPTNETGYGFVDSRTPELSMAVRPEWRGRGVGTLLLERLLREADQRHAAVSLSVSDENPAIRLYERFGFVAIGSSGGSTTMRRIRPEHGGRDA
jgi:GNAT superfamily N-acetyltransferase